MTTPPLLLRLLVVLGLTLLVTTCAPRAQLTRALIADELAASQSTGTGTVDHDALEAALSAHVRTAAGEVDYASLKADRADLDAYVAAIAALDLATLGRDEQMALLINAYNAFTLTLIVEAYPDLTSIRDLHQPWAEVRWTLGGHTISLDELEHGLLRPLYRDPRVHFAINCASVGYPPLRESAFTGAGLDAQLDAAVTDTLARPAYVHVAGDQLALTSLLRWFGDDFVDPDFHGSRRSVQSWTAQFAPGPIREFVLADGPEPRIQWLE